MRNLFLLSFVVFIKIATVNGDNSICEAVIKLLIECGEFYKGDQSKKHLSVVLKLSQGMLDEIQENNKATLKSIVASRPLEISDWFVITIKSTEGETVEIICREDIDFCKKLHKMDVKDPNRNDCFKTTKINLYYNPTSRTVTFKVPSLDERQQQHFRKFYESPIFDATKIIDIIFGDRMTVKERWVIRRMEVKEDKFNIYDAAGKRFLMRSDLDTALVTSEVAKSLADLFRRNPHELYVIHRHPEMATKDLACQLRKAMFVNVMRHHESVGLYPQIETLEKTDFTVTINDRFLHQIKDDTKQHLIEDDMAMDTTDTGHQTVGLFAETPRGYGAIERFMRERAKKRNILSHYIKKLLSVPMPREEVKFSCWGKACRIMAEELWKYFEKGRIDCRGQRLYSKNKENKIYYNDIDNHEMVVFDPNPYVKIALNLANVGEHQTRLPVKKFSFNSNSRKGEVVFSGGNKISFEFGKDKISDIAAKWIEFAGIVFNWGGVVTRFYFPLNRGSSVTWD